MSEQPFALREYVAGDEGLVVYSWLKSYAHSRYGMARGAHEDASPAEMLYWATHRPIVMDLLGSERTVIACDAEQPHVVWGWACLSGGDTIHYVLAKRTAHQAGISAELYRALLGDRLARACGYTHELVDFKRQELRAQGLSLPKSWYADTTWLARRVAA